MVPASNSGNASTPCNVFFNEWDVTAFLKIKLYLFWQTWLRETHRIFFYLLANCILTDLDENQIDLQLHVSIDQLLFYNIWIRGIHFDKLDLIFLYFLSDAVFIDILGWIQHLTNFSADENLWILIFDYWNLVCKTWLRKTMETNFKKNLWSNSFFQQKEVYFDRVWWVKLLRFFSNFLNPYLHTWLGYDKLLEEIFIMKNNSFTDLVEHTFHIWKKHGRTYCDRFWK